MSEESRSLRYVTARLANGSEPPPWFEPLGAPVAIIGSATGTGGVKFPYSGIVPGAAVALEIASITLANPAANAVAIQAQVRILSSDELVTARGLGADYASQGTVEMAPPTPDGQRRGDSVAFNFIKAVPNLGGNLIVTHRELAVGTTYDYIPRVPLIIYPNFVEPNKPGAVTAFSATADIQLRVVFNVVEWRLKMNMLRLR